MHPHPSSWDVVGEAAGVRVRAHGSGAPVVVVPGMEGDGTSCLHVVEAVRQRLGTTAPLRVLLVDYGAERHRGLAELEASVLEALGTRAGAAPIVWGQSFGCLLAAVVARALDARALVLVSPFTRLPAGRTTAARSLAVTPRSLYAWTSPTVSRWLFGPVGTHRDHPFFATLAHAAPGDVARRTSWLRGRDLRERFEGRARPTCAWFGTQDRLIDLPEQLDAFGTILGPGARLGLVPGAGHVVLPDAAVVRLADGLADWITDVGVS